MAETKIVDAFFWGATAFFLLAFALYLLYFFHKKRNFLKVEKLNVKIKKVTQASLLVAISSAIVLLFYYVFPFQSLIFLRISIQGVIIKVVGFLFGPIVGVCVAVSSEITVLIFAPSYFHYKFLITLVGFGFFAGIVKEIKDRIQNIFGRIVILFSSLAIFWFFSFLFIYMFQTKNGFDISKMFTWVKNNYLRNPYFIINTVSFLSIALFSFVVLCVVFWFRNSKNKTNKIFIYNMNNLVAIFIFAIISEYFVNVAISSSANSAFLGETNKSPIIIFTGAIFLAPLKIIFSTLIVYVVWKTINPLVLKNK